MRPVEPEAIGELGEAPAAFFALLEVAHNNATASHQAVLDTHVVIAAFSQTLPWAKCTPKAAAQPTTLATAVAYNARSPKERAGIQTGGAALSLGAHRRIAECFHWHSAQTWGTASSGYATAQATQRRNVGRVQ